MAPDAVYESDPDALRRDGHTHVRLRAPSDAHPDCQETDGFSLSVAGTWDLRPLPHDLPSGYVCWSEFVLTAG